MDELEGTLRDHIGCLIEAALDRLEGTATEADRGKKIYAIQGSARERIFADFARGKYYGKRGRT